MGRLSSMRMKDFYQYKDDLFFDLAYYFFLLPLFSWYYAFFAEFVVHGFVHSRFCPRWFYFVHRAHHSEYTADKLLQDKYRGKGGNALLILALPFMGLLFLVFEFTSACITLGSSLFFIYISDYVHQQIHIRGSHLEKF